MPIDPLEPLALKALLDRGEPLTLVDVREDWERERACLEPSCSIPLGELPGRLDELPRDRLLVFVCHHGVRSHQACIVAQSKGLRVANLVGGIEAWSTAVDPRVPRY